MKYCMVSDNDGHWYIIEKAKEKEFWKWVEDIERYWQEANYDEPEPEFEWLESLPGTVSSVSFDSYELK